MLRDRRMQNSGMVAWGELTVKVGSTTAVEVASSATVEVELSSWRTFWASSAKTPPAKAAAAQAMVAAVNFMMDVVIRI
jgi:hypothetical protein